MEGAKAMPGKIIFVFWQKWLFLVSLLIFVFGLAMVFLGGTAYFSFFSNYINSVFWDTVEVADSLKEFQQWIYGVLGATMAGWGIMLLFISHYSFRKREKWSWNCITIAIAIWFLMDTSISLYSKVAFNAAFNTLILLLVILPLIFTRKYFSGKDQGIGGENANQQADI